MKHDLEVRVRHATPTCCSTRAAICDDEAKLMRARTCREANKPQLSVLCEVSSAQHHHTATTPLTRPARQASEAEEQRGQPGFPALNSLLPTYWKGKNAPRKCGRSNIATTPQPPAGWRGIPGAVAPGRGRRAHKSWRRRSRRKGRRGPVGREER